MVCQVDGCCLAGLGSIVDGQLPTAQHVGHPDFQVTGVAFLTIGAEPVEADAIREDLGAPENLQGACHGWDSNEKHGALLSRPKGQKVLKERYTKPSNFSIIFPALTPRRKKSPNHLLLPMKD